MQMKEIDQMLENKLCLLHDLLAVDDKDRLISDPRYSELFVEVYEARTLKEYVMDLISIEDIFSKERIALLTKIRKYILGS